MSSQEKNVLSTVQSLVTTPEPKVSGHEYLTGVRGFLTIHSFLFVFLTVFAPTTVKNSQNPDGPVWQEILRKTLSVLFWNDNLIYSSIIFLSGRTVCLNFLTNPTSDVLASTLFRRTCNLLLPVALAFALSVGLLSDKALGIEYIKSYTAQTGNKSLPIPYQIPEALAYFNSIFNLFFITNEYATQAAAVAFPSGTIWIISVVYMQSYTIYMAMLVIPYTRKTWRAKVAILFIICAWWVQSWAWFSITALLLADAVMHMDFKESSAKGIHIWRNFRLPTWVLYATLMAVGLMLQYLWTAWRPEYQNYELEGHTGLYYTGSYNSNYDIKQPQARDDNYLVILGFWLWLESSNILQYIFSNRIFTFLGRRSYSYLLTQNILIYTAGIKLWQHVIPHTSAIGANLAAFFICIVATLVFGEIMHRCVDIPGRKGANILWQFVSS